MIAIAANARYILSEASLIGQLPPKDSFPSGAIFFNAQTKLDGKDLPARDIKLNDQSVYSTQNLEWNSDLYRSGFFRVDKVYYLQNFLRRWSRSDQGRSAKSF